MEHHEPETTPKRRLKKRKGKTIMLGAVVSLLVAAGLLVYFLAPGTMQEFAGTEKPTTAKRSSTPVTESDREKMPAETDSVTEKSGRWTLPATTETDVLRERRVGDPTPRAAEPGQQTSAAPEQQTTAEPGQQTAASPEHISDQDSAPRQIPEEPSECLQRAERISRFFDTLDSRAYMQEFDLEQKSSVYFPRLIQKLVNNPPVVSGETDDLFTILQNTAHFFRIIGKKNIIILKGILDREKPTFETVLADFYELTDRPECLERHFNLTITPEPLYKYAGFFLNTMGGRLYLFRRDSMSRMVVNYYAILIIERANREGRNKFGIEIDTAILNLIEEIESSNIQLVMRDVYLDTLYELREKYQ